MERADENAASTIDSISNANEPEATLKLSASSNVGDGKLETEIITF